MHAGAEKFIRQFKRLSATVNKAQITCVEPIVKRNVSLESFRDLHFVINLLKAIGLVNDNVYAKETCSPTVKNGSEIYGSKVLTFNKFTLSMLATFDATERKQQFRRSFSQCVSQPLPRLFQSTGA